MKKLIFILCFLLASYMTYGQKSYKPCLDEERTKWSIIGDLLDWGKSSFDLMAYRDTIINGLSYKRIYEEYNYELKFEDTNTIWKDRIDYTGESEKYFIRESEDASKLYVYNAYSQKEYLVSDMNLEVGDKFLVPELWRNYWFLNYKDTLVVDSVYKQDGLKHIRFYQQEIFQAPIFPFDYSCPTIFIEGIGPNIGIFSDFAAPLMQVVNCFQNQSLYYKNESVPYPCGYRDNPDAVNKVFSGKEYSVKVNENNIEVYSSVNEPFQVILFDLSGRVCYNQAFPAMHNGLIPRFFSPGVYLLKIAAENKSQSQVLKIIL